MSNRKPLDPAIKEKLENAQSAEDVIAIIKAEGREIIREDAEKIWEDLKLWKEKGQGSTELSEDELENVPGGMFHWWDDVACFFSGHEKGPYVMEKRKDGYYIGRYLCTNCGKYVWLKVYDDGSTENADESDWDA